MEAIVRVVKGFFNVIFGTFSSVVLVMIIPKLVTVESIDKINKSKQISCIKIHIMLVYNYYLQSSVNHIFQGLKFVDTLQ